MAELLPERHDGRPVENSARLTRRPASIHGGSFIWTNDLQLELVAGSSALIWTERPHYGSMIGREDLICITGENTSRSRACGGTALLPSSCRVAQHNVGRVQEYSGDKARDYDIGPCRTQEHDQPAGGDHAGVADNIIA